MTTLTKLWGRAFGFHLLWMDLSLWSPRRSPNASRLALWYRSLDCWRCRCNKGVYLIKTSETKEIKCLENWNFLIFAISFSMAHGDTIKHNGTYEICKATVPVSMMHLLLCLPKSLSSSPAEAERVWKNIEICTRKPNRMVYPVSVEAKHEAEQGTANPMEFCHHCRFLFAREDWRRCSFAMRQGQHKEPWQLWRTSWCGTGT